MDGPGVPAFLKDALGGGTTAADYLVKEGLRDGRAAVMDKADELILIGGPAIGTLFNPKPDPADYWKNEVK